MKKKHKIICLIEQGEGLHLDFKFEVSDPPKIARSLVSFANTEGGKLLIGVKDNGNISGIRLEEEYYMIENAAAKYCTPVLNFNSKEWVVEGKKVLEVYISKSNMAPHRAPDNKGKLRAYVRVNDQNILANGVQMKIWQKLIGTKDIKLIYSEEVKRLMEILKKHNSLLLSQLIPMLELSRFKTENLLAELIIMKVIKMNVSEFDSSFSLCDPTE
ncbi:MAG: ATP-binding protein [Bacteroidetes bacterium]|nr:ATP-binding protein [Bacteroidota bacterium]